MSRDPQLVAAIAEFIRLYRLDGRDPKLTQREVLGAYPSADAGDYAAGLIEANMRRDLARDG